MKTKHVFPSTGRLLFVLMFIIAVGYGGIYFLPRYLHKPQEFFISPSGSDSASGTAVNQAYKTINHALEFAQPGDTIHLAPGEYMQDIKTVRSGNVDKPITLIGPPDAVVKGTGNARIIEVQHNYLTFSGFTVDGLHGNPDEPSSYRDKLVYLLSTQKKKGVEGVRLLGMTFQNSGGECVRLRYFAKHNEIAYSNFYHCGVFDYVFNQGGKNGEGVYIGTAPEQDGQSGAPSDDSDESTDNWIHHNYFDPQGSECVNIKEHAGHNVITDNICLNNYDETSAGFDIRSECNVISHNQLGNVGVEHEIRGAGIRIAGGDDGDAQYNDITQNLILSYSHETAVKYPTDEKPGLVCGNQDAAGSTTFNGKFADSNDADNATQCPNDTLPPGPRGCVGSSCATEKSIYVPPKPSASQCLPV